MGRELYKNKYRTDSIRLKGWNYASPGNYFITICTKKRGNVFGRVVDGAIILNKKGEVVKKWLMDIPKHFTNVTLNSFTVMNDHVHILLRIKNIRNNAAETQQCCVSAKHCNDHKNTNYKSNTFYRLSPGSIPVIIRSYKSKCSQTIHKMENNKTFEWQGSYYDQIIFDERYLQNVKTYIKLNHNKHKNT